VKDQAQNSHGHGHGYGHRAFISSACHKGRREQSYFFAVSDHFALGIQGIRMSYNVRFVLSHTIREILISSLSVAF
jgi:hypothetical protein